MRAVPAALMMNPRLNMACDRPAKMARFMGSLSPFRDFG